jgi:hypothetical protein
LGGNCWITGYVGLDCVSGAAGVIVESGAIEFDGGVNGDCEEGDEEDRDENCDNGGDVEGKDKGDEVVEVTVLPDLLSSIYFKNMIRAASDDGYISRCEYLERYNRLRHRDNK